MNVEAEIKAFLTDAQYDRLIQFFQANAQEQEPSEQVTYYYKAEKDLRIQENTQGAKLILKEGKVHDEARQELEVPFEKMHASTAHALLKSLGYPLEVKWIRKRRTFLWDALTVTIDDTKVYGKIIEIEKMCTAEQENEVVAHLKEKLAQLEVKLTPRSVFEHRFKEYKENWRQLIN